MLADARDPVWAYTQIVATDDNDDPEAGSPFARSPSAPARSEHRPPTSVRVPPVQAMTQPVEPPSSVSLEDATRRSTERPLEGARPSAAPIDVAVVSTSRSRIVFSKGR